MTSLDQDRAVVLIVDSDPLLLTGMAAVLHMQGYACHCAQGGEAAVKAASREPLDLIICDVHLKRESGLELCRELRRHVAVDVPVLFVSATQQADIVRRAYDSGGAYFLRKPFHPEVLIELVDKALWMPHLIKSNVERTEQARPASAAPAPKLAGLRSKAQTPQAAALERL